MSRVTFKTCMYSRNFLKTSNVLLPMYNLCQTFLRHSIRSMKHRNFLFIRFAYRDITYFIYRNTFDIMAYAIYTAYILLL